VRGAELTAGDAPTYSRYPTAEAYRLVKPKEVDLECLSTRSCLRTIWGCASRTV